jgi:hypothetical protein
MENEEKTSNAGAPSKYQTEFEEQVFKLCLLGATDKHIADFFGVCEATINNWKHEYPKFLESIRNGKERADIEIANALYHRAKGCSIKTQKAIKVKIDQYQEKVEVVDLEEAYPPDPVCIKYFMNNRNPDRWKDKTTHEQTGPGGGPIDNKITIEFVKKEHSADVENS